MPRSDGKPPKSKPEAPSSTTESDTEFQVTAERYSTIWEDEIETRDQLRALREVKAKRAKRYEAASKLGAALAEHITDKLTAEAFEVIFALVASGSPPTVVLKALRAWGHPLDFFMAVVAAMETDLQTPCDLSALKSELAKEMLADAETTGAPQ